MFKLSGSLLLNKDIPVDLRGTVTLKKFIFKKKYKFSFREKINSKDFFMIRVEKFKSNDAKNAPLAFAIRSKVFVDEQKVSREEEFDEFEADAVHYIVYNDDSPAGASRWRFTANGIKLERFAVLKEFRGKGIGEAVLKAMLNDVLPLGKKIYLHAQVSAEGFYLKYSFESVGEHFWEANIEHVLMEYKQ